MFVLHENENQLKEYKENFLYHDVQVDNQPTSFPCLSTIEIDQYEIPYLKFVYLPEIKEIKELCDKAIALAEGNRNVDA